MPRQKKVKEVVSVEPVVEPVEPKQEIIEESIQKPKREKKVKKEKTEAQKIIDEKRLATKMSKQEALINKKALELFEKLKGEKQVVPVVPEVSLKEEEEDEIIVVKKKQVKRQPRKKVIYIDDPDETIDDVVQFNHPETQPQIIYW
jgi:hypothetical protein